MRRIVAFLAVLLAACTTLEGVRRQNRERLGQVTIGMTKDEVLGIMGTETAWPMRQVAARGWHGRVPNPYRHETIRTKDRRPASVYFYYTAIIFNDGYVTDPELTPLIFDENDRLVGIGCKYLKDVRGW